MAKATDYRLRAYPATRFRDPALAVIMREGRVESWEAYALVAGEAGLDYRDFDPGRMYQVNPLDIRVRTALNGLAAVGLIRKVSRGERQPRGNRDAKYAVYYSPERYATDEKEAAEARAIYENATSRWARVEARLASLGITMHEGRLSLKAWEGKVLPALEKKE